jgi:hypothetical protein
MAGRRARSLRDPAKFAGVVGLPSTMAPLVPIREGAAQISRKRNRSAVIF